MRTYGLLSIGDRFIRTKETKHGNACIYEKIAPTSLYGDRNAVRCWEEMSEFVKFSDSECVIKIVS